MTSWCICRNALREKGGLSYADFEDWRTQATSFQGLSFIGEKRIQLREGTGRPSDQLTFTVSVNLFGLLGVPPMLGRDFVPLMKCRARRRS